MLKLKLDVLLLHWVISFLGVLLLEKGLKGIIMLLLIEKLLVFYELFVLTVFMLNVLLLQGVLFILLLFELFKLILIQLFELLLLLQLQLILSFSLSF